MRLSTLIAKAEDMVVRNAPKAQATVLRTTLKTTLFLQRQLNKVEDRVQDKLHSPATPCA